MFPKAHLKMCFCTHIFSWRGNRTKTFFKMSPERPKTRGLDGQGGPGRQADGQTYCLYQAYCTIVFLVSLCTNVNMCATRFSMLMSLPVPQNNSSRYFFCSHIRVSCLSICLRDCMCACLSYMCMFFPPSLSISFYPCLDWPFFRFQTYR